MKGRLLCVWIGLVCGLSAERLELVLPTENRHLFSGEPEKFYMYVDRNFEGDISKPWEGGAFGYVRTPVRVGAEVVLTKFHEGIDIAPVKRDRAGNPLDLVMSIAAGRVVHSSTVAGRSNYGKYVVVEHSWEDSLIYSLYAHLADVSCEPGDPVKAGSVLGRMGCTGAGLNRTRAHLHLEVALLSSRRYEDWHKQYAGGTNYHGVFNGMNLAGVDVASLFLEHSKNPGLKFSEFVLSRPVQFKVTVPGGELPEVLARHPWMLVEREVPKDEALSWEIGFAATGHPVSFTPGRRIVTQPVVSHLRPSHLPQRYLTRGLLTGEGTRVELSRGGRQMLALVMDEFPENATQ